MFIFTVILIMFFLVVINENWFISFSEKVFTFQVISLYAYLDLYHQIILIFYHYNLKEIHLIIYFYFYFSELFFLWFIIKMNRFLEKKLFLNYFNFYHKFENFTLAIFSRLLVFFQAGVVTGSCSTLAKEDFPFSLNLYKKICL